MTDICKRLGFDRSTIWRHIRANPEFCNAHARAREAQAEAFADKATQVANDGTNDTYVDSEGRQRIDYDNVRRSELRVRQYQWLCSKLAPNVYGDRNNAPAVAIQQNNNGMIVQTGGPQTNVSQNAITPEKLERIRRRVAEPGRECCRGGPDDANVKEAKRC